MEMHASYLAPVVTLYQPDGGFDFNSQGSLYENLIKNGIDGILVLGSIGEFFAMTLEQRQSLAEFTIRSVDHRIKTIIGTGSMVSTEIAPFSNRCLDMGADGVIIVPPFYFQLGDSALMRFFDELLPQIHGPVYLYNFPDRTGYTIPADMVLALAERHPNLAGIKDSITGMDHTREIIVKVKSRFPKFEVYSGFDENAAHNVLSGGDGAIGGLANFVPEICSNWTRAMRNCDMQGIVSGQKAINRLMDIYSVSDQFIPVIKAAARMRGYVSTDSCLFPMDPVTPDQEARIAGILRAEGIVLSERFH